jgi:hypothetical protein
MASIFDQKNLDGSDRYHRAGNERQTFRLRRHYDELIKFRETVRGSFDTEPTEAALAHIEAELLRHEFLLAFERLRARAQLDGRPTASVHWPPS